MDLNRASSATVIETAGNVSLPEVDEDLASLDPAGRLYNPDLAPAAPSGRTWSTYSLFAFWSNTAHNLGAYTFAAGLFALGLTAWQETIGILGGALVVFAGCLLSGAMGQRTGLPFPVLSRLSWGVFGANIPALIRALAAIAWYGIQTYLAAAAVNAMALRFVPGAESLTHQEFLGLDGLSWISFLLLWAIQLLILSRGLEIVRHVQGWSGAVIWLIMIALAIWLLVQAHGQISLTSSEVQLSSGEQVHQVFASMGLLMGILGTLMLNYADFTRFAPSESSVRRGTFWGVPVNWALFIVTAVVISAGSKAVYGQAILNPADIFQRLSNPVMLIVGAGLLIFAAVGVNIIANFVAPAFDIANVSPRHISFRKGGVITAVIALVSLPWKMYSTPVVINYFLGGLGALIGPLFAIMVVDYYVIKRQEVQIKELYRPDARSPYFFRNGINPRAVAAFVPAAVLSVVVATVPGLSEVAPFAWYIGTAAAALFYFVAMRNTREIRS
jgi:NCS1 family nucleobase:cation symporter-1